MRNFKKLLLWTLLVAIFTTSLAFIKSTDIAILNQQNVEDQKLYETIVRLDSAFFHAYNTCDMNLNSYADFYSDTIEFFHDQGGLMNSKRDIVEATRKNICGKVTRELVKGSIEVYGIKDYGAVEIGLHKFQNNTEPEHTPSKATKFIIIWKQVGKDWRITKVISLH